MNPDAQRIIADLRIANQNLERAKSSVADLTSQLDRIWKHCQHHWGEIKKVEERQPGYTIPGDPPGTMGVDWRGPTYVESKTDVWYERECQNCGKVETTTQTKPSKMVADFE